MHTTPLSTCEREFILKAFSENLRLDGRDPGDFRKFRISLGKEPGCCFVSSGYTKVLAQVSCSLTVPRQGRPNEGSVAVNVEMSTMASASHESGRLGEGGLRLVRMLEGMIKESHCINTESLCVQSGEKAWEIRVDVHVLDHDGGLADACSVAAISALCHFRRPDVSVVGEEIVVHPANERDPIPLNLYHRPIAVTFAFSSVSGEIAFADPIEKEELVADGTITIVANSRKEICSIQCTGELTLSKSQILRCASNALQRSLEVLDEIKTALSDDAQIRAKREPPTLSAKLESKDEISGQLNVLPQPSTSKESTSIDETSQNPLPQRFQTTGNTAHLGATESSLMTLKSAGKKGSLTEPDDLDIVEAITNAKISKPPTKDIPPKGRRQNIPKTKNVMKLLEDIEDDVTLMETTDVITEKRALKESVKTEPEADIDLSFAIKKTKKAKNKGKS